MFLTNSQRENPMSSFKVLREMHHLDTPFNLPLEDGEYRNFFVTKIHEGKWNQASFCTYITIAIYSIENNIPKFLAEVKYASNSFPSGSDGELDATYHYLKSKGFVPTLKGRYNFLEALGNFFKIH